MDNTGEIIPHSSSNDSTEVNSPSLSLEATSQFDIEEFKIQWKLNIFSYGNLAKTETIESPVFKGGERGLHSWKLRWKPERERWDSYTIEVILVSIGEARFATRGKIKAAAFISFKEPEFIGQLQLAQEQHDLQLFAVESGNKLPMQSSSINYDQLSDQAIINSALTIHCRILVSCGIKQGEVVRTISENKNQMKIKNEVESSELVVSQRNNNSLADVMRTVLSSMEFADVQLVTQSKPFPAHKVILAARSPVFGAMFRTNMVEASENTVEIADFDENIVETMLEFIYTGSSSKLKDNNCTDLLRISDKYEILELKEECEQFLCLSLKIENAVEALILATLHNAQTLKAAAMTFVHKNKPEICGRNDAFQKLVETDPSLLLELYLAL